MKDLIKIIAFVKVYGLNIYGIQHFSKNNLESYFLLLGWTRDRINKAIKLLMDKGIIRKEKVDAPNFYSLSILHRTHLNFF